ncbi:MAG TPA: permease, partial [Gaiellales bacterium]|nr:permease [Gaiellales bacterium]
GISFGGVLAFIFADLVILPILDIYRRYYGRRVALFLFAVFYATMAASGLAVELVFQAVGLVPEGRHAKVVEAAVSWNYTTFLNIAFLALAAILVVRFVSTGGLPMLRMMGAPMDHDGYGHGHAHGHG